MCGFREFLSSGLLILPGNLNTVALTPPLQTLCDLEYEGRRAGTLEASGSLLPAVPGPGADHDLPAMPPWAAGEPDFFTVALLWAADHQAQGRSLSLLGSGSSSCRMEGRRLAVPQKGSPALPCSGVNLAENPSPSAHAIRG